jgi:hypothetical protein
VIGQSANVANPQIWIEKYEVFSEQIDCRHHATIPSTELIRLVAYDDNSNAVVIGQLGEHRQFVGAGRITFQKMSAYLNSPQQPQQRSIFALQRISLVPRPISAAEVRG